jgi:transcriptional regulator with XRE-family HTH domain
MEGQQVIEILKKKLQINADYKLGEKLNLDKSEVSRVRRGHPAKKILQKVEEVFGLDFYEEIKAEMNRTDSTSSLNSEKQLLQEKERTITIQQSYIERLEKTIERLEEDKKKRNQTNVPQWYNQTYNCPTSPV